MAPEDRDAPLSPAKARLCALIHQLSEGDVAILVRMAERMLPRPDAQPATGVPASRSAQPERRTPATPARPQSHEPAAPAPERLTYTVPESAALLGVSESLLWKEIRNGRVPVLRIARRTLIQRQTIERLLTEGDTRPRH